MGLSTPLRRTWALGRACLDAPAAKTGMLLHATKPVPEATALAHAASAAASRRGRGFATNPGLDEEAAAAACGVDEGLVELLGYSHVRDPNLNLQDERCVQRGGVGVATLSIHPKEGPGYQLNHMPIIDFSMA